MRRVGGCGIPGKEPATPTAASGLSNIGGSQRERAMADEERLIEGIGRVAKPLKDDADLDPLLERIGDARVVLLGEASHGTHEFYTWRDRITRRLVAEKGFGFIAVEGDWPDCYLVNRWIKGVDGGRSAREMLHAFERWPTW